MDLVDKCYAILHCKTCDETRAIIDSLSDEMEFKKMILFLYMYISDNKLNLKTDD